jgi:hypothetical protein
MMYDKLSRALYLNARRCVRRARENTTQVLGKDPEEQ